MRKPRAGVARARDPHANGLTLSPRLPWALAAASAAVGLGLVPLLATSDFLPDRAFWIVLDLVIGAGFTAVGLFAWYRRPDNRVGALMVATAFAWYFVIAGNTEVAALWTLGQLFSNLFAATAIHLLLAFPSGRLETAFDRVVVAIAYAATTVLWLPFMFFTAPAGWARQASMCTRTSRVSQRNCASCRTRSSCPTSDRRRAPRGTPWRACAPRT